ncbi:Werner Syndrome exonuclease [Spatholobus suberectus]|nr:Werner Syndrome exonuclease [Spatholobus suberectus]
MTGPVDENGTRISSRNVTSNPVAAVISVVDHYLPYDTHNLYDNPVATLQLCVGNRCLVFQILHSPSIPPSLFSFLADPNVTFVGVGIHEDAEKLLEDHNLNVANVCDLRPLAAEKLGDPELNRAGLKTLGLRVLGLEIQKPQWITRSRWDNPWLTAEQVQYAAVDAFLSYEIGRRLSSYY